MAAAPIMGMFRVVMGRAAVARPIPMAIMAAGRQQKGQSGNNSHQQNVFTHRCLLSRRDVSRKGATTMPNMQQTKSIEFLESGEGLTGKIFSSSAKEEKDECQNF